MTILIGFAFLAGIVTILSPCILPVLPILLASAVSPGKSSHSRPFGIVFGFALSFTLFTLFLSQLVRVSGIPSDALRHVAIIIVGLLGLSLLVPRLQITLEQLFTRLASLAPQTKVRPGLGGGVLTGVSLGLLWTPCVGPILASIIALAATGEITLDAFLITLAYALGTAIPMLLIILGGQTVLKRSPWLLRNTGKIQRGFGVVMIATALILYAGLDRTFQSYILSTFPQYGAGLTKLEDNQVVKSELEDMGKPEVNLARKGNKAPELIQGGEWFNSEPLKLADLKGKVVLLDFWTYSCINCQRTFPYLKEWDRKYRDKGLVIIGVHAPEFEFEKDPKNVEKALADFGLTYPVMQDNDFATWQAYKNRYWPAKYFIDHEGNLRGSHFGEGDYDESEAMIQQLLKEAGAEVSDEMNNPSYRTYARTPETYLGSLRSQKESYLTYEGTWQQSEEYASPAAGSKLNLKFDAKEVYLVMKNNGTPAKIKVFVDDKFTNAVTVTADTLYTIVTLTEPGRHTLRLEFEDGHAQLFAFTFG